MINLNDYNKERWTLQKTNFKEELDIACPECGNKIYDTDPNVMLLTDPGQKQVACTVCDFRGTRVCQ